MTERESSTARRLFARLAVLCFAIHALAPAGYMPGALTDGTPFVLCPGQHPGLAQLISDLSDSSGHDHEHSSDSASMTAMDMCSFASVSSPTIADGLAFELAFAGTPTGVRTDASTPALSTRPPQHPARGPPALPKA